MYKLNFSLGLLSCLCTVSLDLTRSGRSRFLLSMILVLEKSQNVVSATLVNEGMYTG